MSPAERREQHIDKCPMCGAWRWDGACRGACPAPELAAELELVEELA